MVGSIQATFTIPPGLLAAARSTASPPPSGFASALTICKLISTTPPRLFALKTTFA